ncbi:MAG: haloacid dehalogenase [Promethearchaeota archaeon]
MQLKKIFSEITKELDNLDQDREEILKISRQMIRNCGIAIKAIHRKDYSLYKEKIESIEKDHELLRDLVNKNPFIFEKYLKTPEQEYIEAVCLYAIIENKDFPKPADYNVISINYLLGIADVIGELRRYALDQIRAENFDKLDYILEKMEELYTYLFSLDYPKGLVQDLRHKTDIARNLIERTRGDISLSLQMNRLKNTLKK